VAKKVSSIGTERTAVTALERRIATLEQRTNSQSRELWIQSARIAQMQAEWGALRRRLKS
jgi:hypothetical protein